MDNQIPGSNYEYSTLMNVLHVSVSKHLLDEHFTLVWANDFYYDLIGYSKPEYEALYHNRPSLYYAQQQDEWNKISATTISALQSGKKGYSIPSRMRRKNGEYIWIRMSATFTDEYIDGYQVSYTVMMDINDIMLMQQEQSVTYDALPGFIARYRVGKGLQFTLLDANQRFFDFFGEESWKNQDYPLFCQNVERNAETFLMHEPMLEKGEPVHFITHMMGQNGQDAWLQLNATCIDWQEGQPVYLVIYIDVTNETELRLMQKKLEDQAAELRDALSQAKAANRAKSDFLSNMSHDIRTPMNAIIGMTDIAIAHIGDTEKVHDCLRKISLSSKHLLGLINDVLDMSKIESGKMVLRNDTMSLPEVLENVVAIIQPQFKEKSQRFSIRLHNVCHEQFCSDALRLRQIFLNILSNSYKFTPEGGSITVDVYESSMEDPDLARLLFVFTDTGIGMHPDFLAHIFEAFSREQDSRVDKTEGTGLGMAITQRTVQLLGGTIEVESQIGKGTSFRVELPLKIECAEPKEEHPLNIKVLVVDDDEIMCECTAEILGRLGACTAIANTGEQAIAQMLQASEQKNPFDAVLLDWKMPGQDGLQTARRLRKLFGDSLPILIISAYDWEDIEQEAHEVGITVLLNKPLFPSTLSRTLQKYVLGRRLPPNGKEQTRQINLEGKRFLLVEDNTLNQEVAAELLQDAGAKIEIACDGAQGVQKFEQSAKGYYDMILMDIQMPVMNGYEATKAIRKLPREDAARIPVLAMTADAFAEDISMAKAAGMDGHLAKPLDETTLKREIGRYLYRGKNKQ